MGEDDKPKLDLSDPLIQEMVERNHVPREIWNPDGILRGVLCESCNNDWPCATIVELRRRDAGQ